MAGLWLCTTENRHTDVSSTASESRGSLTASQQRARLQIGNHQRRPVSSARFRCGSGNSTAKVNAQDGGAKAGGRQETWGASGEDDSGALLENGSRVWFCLQASAAATIIAFSGAFVGELEQSVLLHNVHITGLSEWQFVRWPLPALVHGELTKHPFWSFHRPPAQSRFTQRNKMKQP